MAMTAFQYIHKTTWLHQLDGRSKLLSLILLTASVSMANKWEHFLLLTCLLVVALIFSMLPMMRIIKELKWLGVLVVMIFFISGWELAIQLSLMVLVSALMVGTTTSSTINHSIAWYLRPIPFIPEVRIATMIHLIFVLIPMILSRYQEMKHAQQSRCIDLRKNPIKRLKFITYPLLNRMLKSADELVLAMEARCYSELRTPMIFKPGKGTLSVVFICFATLLFVLLF